MSDSSDKPNWWTTDHWATPPEVVELLAKEFGTFDLDPCARPDTAKASKFFTEADNGLTQEWFGRVWLNPPYSKPGPWLEKALAEVNAGRAEIVVALLPTCTDTRWFHDFVWGRSEVRFPKGRIRFLGWRGAPIGSPRQPSMFAIYRRNGHSV